MQLIFLGNHKSRGTGLIIVSIKIAVFLVIIFFSAGNIDSRQKSAISNSKGKELLEIIKNLGNSAFQNSEEYAFHLCELAVERLQNPVHQRKIRDYLYLLATVRKVRDQKMKRTLSGKMFFSIYSSEFQAAKLLYRFAAASLLSSLILGKEDLIVPENTKKMVRQLFPGITRKVPGYKLEWQEMFKGEELHLNAIPIRYSRDGFRSFLFIYNKGIVTLYAGDFGGSKVDLSKKRTKKIHLRKFFPD
jgi:hypothetical protein